MQQLIFGVKWKKKIGEENKILSIWHQKRNNLKDYRMPAQREGVNFKTPSKMLN